MKKNRSLAFFACIPLLILHACVSLTQAPDPLTPVKSTINKIGLYRAQTVAKIAGRSIKVDLFKSRYDPMKHGEVRLDGESPRYVLSGLSVTIDGKDIQIPPSSYARFGDPHIRSVDIMTNSEAMYIYLSGGDGGGSHARRLVFVDGSYSRVEFRDYFTGRYE